ncbi:MAG: helix-turn-helix transcriptional regulator [Synergistaceae bacterium]|nr:helix-turn-helix transcriptional regulator [Synergistaceae bacterium]
MERHRLIAERRKELGLTQKQLADQLGVRPSAISNYEIGIRRPRGKIAVKLSEILGIPLEEIIV